MRFRCSTLNKKQQKSWIFDRAFGFIFRGSFVLDFHDGFDCRIAGLVFFCHIFLYEDLCGRFPKGYLKRTSRATRSTIHKNIDIGHTVFLGAVRNPFTFRATLHLNFRESSIILDPKLTTAISDEVIHHILMSANYEPAGSVHLRYF